MKRRYVRGVALVCLVGLGLLTGCSSKSPATLPDPEDPGAASQLDPGAEPSAAPSQSPHEEVNKPFGVLGTVLGPETLGQAKGANAGPDDLTCTLLPDGYLRLYFVDRASRAIRSVLTDRQRQRFRPDPGDRLASGVSAPRLTSRIEGGWRMYYVKDGALGSASSTDSLNFAADPGWRLTLARAGVKEAGAFFSGSAVVRLKQDSGYRMYIGVGRPGDAGDYVLSARSTDGLSWTMDPGQRVGPASSNVKESASRPFASVNSNGSVALYFVARTPKPGIYTSVGDNGLDFEKKFDTSVPGVLNGVLVPSAGGDQWMYYTTYSAATGATVDVASKPED